MYDTLNLWLPNDAIKESGYLQRVPTLLTNAKETYKQDTGEIYFNGSILGMSASISNAGISLKGSICKSYLNDNFKTLTRQDTQRAIEQLEDILNLPIKEADVKRIDFAQSFTVSQNPQNFFTFLGECNHYKRLTQPKSLYYQNGMRTKLFYNKIAEGKAKGDVLPPIWANKHILRYELRFTSRLPYQFDKAQIQAQNLYNEVFYMDLVDRWIREYETINKNNSILDQMNIKQIETPKDFIYQMALLQIKEVGIQKTLESIEQLKAQNQFKHKEYYSRLKADIKKLCKTEVLTEGSDLIAELDKKVKQVKEYCR
ncbi:MAG: hypothetical protein LC107_07075 [Chitinophagales bacterium]|nr:hypothetical protein [Chitinophagales bacterium]